jgi:hypothetical protein
MAKIIFVVGMHRCGTSLLSNCLNESGFEIGITKNTDRDWQNPNGYFENDSFVEFHDKLLSYNNCSWNDLNKNEMEYLESHVKEYRELIKEEFKDAKKILIKDPRLGVFSNFIKEVCEGVYEYYVIFCTRNKKECCTSLSKAQNLKYSDSEKIYDTMHQNNFSGLTINHRDLINNNTDIMILISRFCNFEIEKNTSKIVDMSLYRNRLGGIRESLVIKNSDEKN